MRILLLVAAVAACDGKPSEAVDAGADGADIDAPPDAEIGIAGTWLDTYITASGSMSKSECTAAPAAIVVDPTTAAITPYTGTCKGDGSFRINSNGNLGTFYLKVGGQLYETTKHAGIDLSTEHLGRSDVAAIAGVTLGFTMTGLDAWAAGDVLTAFGANIGYYQNLSFTTGGPQAGNTSLSGTADWKGYKVEASKSDVLQIVQQGVHTTANALSYLSLDRAYTVPAFTMTNNTMQPVGGAFTAPPPGTVTLNVNVTSFNQFATVANPTVATKTIAGTAYAAPSAEVTTPSPSLVSFARDSAAVSALNFGQLSYGDPFPTAWQRYVKIQEAFAVPYTWNNVTGSFNAQMTRVMTKAEAEANPIDAKLGPPTNPKLDGANAFTATNISPVPVISWGAPTLGTPTDYELVAYEVQISGSTLKFIPTLRLATKQTSLRIPAGYLLGQRQYVFVIRARTRDGEDLYSTPLRTASTSTAETLTALVTTDS
jgi:hypothetical protein